MANLEKIITLTASQYQTLVDGNSITNGGKTYNFDANALYVVPEETITLSDIDGTTDLQAIENLTGTSGFLKKNANTWSLDTNTYLTNVPLAANGTRGGAQIGYTTDATNRNYAVQLSNEKMYVNVPWTDNDTKVTSATNHYTPSTVSEQDNKTASASGATAEWSIDVVKGITINTDGKGHITGLSVTSGKIPGNPNTDTKLTVAEVTSDTTYYPIVGTGTTAATRQYDTTGFVYKGTNGTTSAVGSAQLTLGNSTASGTANNKQGKLVIYGSTAYAHTISGAPTAARTLTLPDKTGTVALTSDIPDVSGKIDTAGTGLSKSGTTLNHSNSVTAQTTQAVYPIKIDAQGHISGYGTAVTLGAAASKGVTDNSSNADVTSSDTNLITGRTLYYQLAKKGYTTNTGTVTSITLKAGTGISLDATGAITTSGERTITNTGVLSIAGKTGEVTLADLGLSSAMRYKGSLSSLPTATSSTTYSTYEAGDVITISSSGKEYVYNKGTSASNSSWVELGDESSYKIKQTSKSDPTASTTTSTTFIDSISQNENGEITATKKTLPAYPTSFTITAATTDGLWDLTGTSGSNKVTYAVGAYSSKQLTAAFYTEATDPTLTTRLNYDGYLYATKLYSSGNEVLTASSTLDAAKLDGTIPSGCYTNSRDAGYGKITPANNTSTISALTGNTTAVQASTYSENLKFTAANKWVVLAGTNSNTAGNDELEIAHLVPSSISNTGPTSNQTGSRGSTFNIPKIEFDAAGHITSISAITVSLPSSDNTDEKVKQNSSTTSSTYKLLMTTVASPTSGNAYETNYTTTLSYNPSTKVLTNGTITLTSASSTTANTAEYDTLSLGNSTNVTSTTAHSEGKIIIYSAATKSHTLVGASTTTDYTHTLPNQTGLLVTLNSTSPSGDIGSTTKPVYVSSSGVVTEADTYAGGTKVTLNGTSAASSSASFYAPTGAGTSGQYLKSNGSGAPSWTNFPIIPTITLNGSSTTSPSFYAPTSAGTSGYYLKSNGSGAPTWESIPTINATASGSGNIVTAISASNHTITYTLETLVSAQIIRW